MLVKGLRRLCGCVATVVFIAVTVTLLWRRHPRFQLSFGGWTKETVSSYLHFQHGEISASGSSLTRLGGLAQPLAESHHIVSSISARDGKYFSIRFGDDAGINPSIIPHPTLDETWIIVAQAVPDPESHSSWFTELVCNARFIKGKLQCVAAPKILPIAATAGDKCVDEITYFSLNIGPHDARVFYGPDVPYTVFGSNSGYTCFGQWIQDLRMLVDWPEPVGGNQFRFATELSRSTPYSAIEKNWFLFWDSTGDAYVHYDVAPSRVFAKLDGITNAVGPDLAPLAATHDATCMDRYMPKVAPELESVHQATNSLSITLCDRTDVACSPTDANTFIMTIFQHKKYHAYHSVYEPYVMLLKRTAPFEIHAISSKPLWIYGRKQAGEAVRPPGAHYAELSDWNQTEMLYVTSMSWKVPGQRYHGYQDDVLFVSFGIEDAATGAIDLVARDLVAAMGYCDEVGSL